jgi:hypothetical protein
VSVLVMIHRIKARDVLIGAKVLKCTGVSSPNGIIRSWGASDGVMTIGPSRSTAPGSQWGREIAHLGHRGWAGRTGGRETVLPQLGHDQG